MKKLISILFLFSLVVSAYSQSTLKTKATTTITNTAWSFNLSTSTADSVGVVQDSLSVPFFINSVDSLDPEMSVKLTEIISPARTIVQYQVRRSTNDSWTTITAQSKLYTGAGTDTTLKFRKLTAYRSWPYHRLLFITNSAEKVKAYPSIISGYFKK